MYNIVYKYIDALLHFKVYLEPYKIKPYAGT